MILEIRCYGGIPPLHQAIIDPEDDEKMTAVENFEMAKDMNKNPPALAS
ncbi:MAG: hypothetical protein P1U85_22510 [Verrucomicrobiales bacterium]|nr:hypothetical protein [Verrucomicrobiales bacterium]